MLRVSLLQKASATLHRGSTLVCNNGTALVRNANPLACNNRTALVRHSSALRPTGRLLSPLVQRSYSTTPKHIRKRNKLAQEAARPPVYAESLLQLRNALDVGNVPHIAHAYAGVRSRVSLGGEDVAQMAQALHTALRQLSPEIKQKRIPEQLIAFADVLAQDIRARSLPPSHSAHLHLISFYKEAAQFDKANNFWAWLIHQDDTYVNPALYGVAVELLAVQGCSAEDSELLYADALKRFPGTFNQYHLSHNAIIADRSKPLNVPGISMTLLQGILTARLLRGDTTNAYLTLDTALRLYPTQVPSRFFALFIQERPVAEAYKVFLLACRTGTILGQDILKMLLTKLRQVAATRPIENAAILRSMLTATYAYIASGATVTSNHVNELVIAITSLLKTDTLTHMSPEQSQRLTDSILDLLGSLSAVWANCNSRPGIAAFNSIITNVAGRGRREHIIETCLADIQRYGLEPNLVTYRSILNAAGDIGNDLFLQKAWTDLVALRITTGAALDIADWQTLAKAAKKFNAQDYVRQQLANFEHIIAPGISNRINGLLDEEGSVKQDQIDATESTEELLKIVELLKLDVDHMLTLIQSPTSQDFRTEPLPLSLEKSALYKDVSELHITEMYDEMTKDESSVPSKATESSTPSARSSTGFSLDELRYQNWKIINELLFESEKYDSEYLAAVDAAIKSGTSPPKRDLGWKSAQRPDEIVGLSNLNSAATKAAQNEQSPDNPTQTHEEDIRQEIFRLRGRLA